MGHVFLSYKSGVGGFSGHLSAHLELSGIATWWDRELKAGDDYQHAIQQAQQSASCTIVIWSRHSIQSPWVRAEADWARSRGSLIPIRVDDVELWPPYNVLHTLNFSEWDGNRQSGCWQQLIAAVTNYQRPAEPTDETIASSGHLIHKLKAKDSAGRWAYYFVLIPAAREAQFLEAIKGDGNVDLEHYGKVVASCYGEAPSAEVIEFLRVRYGFIV